METTDGKVLVAILGGGPAGLATALELTATEELRARYDVTLYQSGWRLGGKCGQGRRGKANRIEINGTHYLFGSYRRVFDLARIVFAELEAKGDRRFGDFNSQFLPCNTIAIEEFFAGNWTTWTITLPGDGEPPGGPWQDLQLGDSLRGIIGWMIAGYRDPDFHCLELSMVATGEAPEWLQGLIASDGRQLYSAQGLDVEALLLLLRDWVDWIEHSSEKRLILEDLLILLRETARLVLRKPAKTSLVCHRILLLIDLGTTTCLGMLEDDVFGPTGFEGIDGQDLRQWLLRHGALPSTAWSGPIATWYNAIAAYERGDPGQPNMSAGMGLQGLLRLGLTWQGAFSFQLNSEIGDSLIAPIHQVLRDRGVRLCYFHRIWDLLPSADGTSIAAVEIECQAELKSGDPASYDPFIDVDGRKVWPDEPKKEQLLAPAPTDANTLSFYAPRGPSTLILKEGQHFHEVVYALPVATARWYCSRLINQRPEWRRMVDGLGTCETQSLRLWLKPTLEQMGWDYGQAVLSGYYEPLATWENEDQLIASETWPPSQTPGSIATLFGVLPGAPLHYPGPHAVDYPEQRTKQAITTAIEFCNRFVGPLWPCTTELKNPVGLDWNKLVVLEDGVQGQDRLYYQSIRGNVGPVDAYTQILKGTLGFRLEADQSGYANLTLSGDWVRNGYEIGSVEGAVQAGQQAAAAIMARRGSGN